MGSGHAYSKGSCNLYNELDIFLLLLDSYDNADPLGVTPVGFFHGDDVGRMFSRLVMMAGVAWFVMNKALAGREEPEKPRWASSSAVFLGPCLSVNTCTLLVQIRLLCDLFVLSRAFLQSCFSCPIL